LLGEWV